MAYSFWQQSCHYIAGTLLISFGWLCVCLVARLCPISVLTNKQNRKYFSFAGFAICWFLFRRLFLFFCFLDSIFLSRTFTPAFIACCCCCCGKPLTPSFSFSFSVSLNSFTGDPASRFPFPFWGVVGFLNATSGSTYLPNYILFQHIQLCPFTRTVKRRQRRRKNASKKKKNVQLNVSYIGRNAQSSAESFKISAKSKCT